MVRWKQAAVAFGALALCASGAKAQALGPSPYLSFADSPFFSGSFTYFHLEDFEDGLLNTPGVSLAAGVPVGPSIFTDSVDDDNGPIDGSGTSGSSLYSNGTESALTFTFDGGALGNFPTNVGIVWTDVGNVTAGNPGFGGVELDVFDTSLNLIATVLGGTLGDGAAQGGTAEDRFLGYVNAGGIGRISLRMTNSTDWEADHLQYGFAASSSAAPEPSALALLALPAAYFLRRRR